MNVANLIRVRRATPKDVPAIVSIWWGLVAEHEKLDPAYWALRPEAGCREAYGKWKNELLESPDHIHLFALIDEAPAGFAHGHRLERPPIYAANPVGRIDEIVVAPSFRRRGVGRAMVGALITALRGMGPETIELMVDADNPSAVALYESMGFYRRQFQMIHRGGWPSGEIPV